MDKNKDTEENRKLASFCDMSLIPEKDCPEEYEQKAENDSEVEDQYPLDFLSVVEIILEGIGAIAVIVLLGGLVLLGIRKITVKKQKVPEEGIIVTGDIETDKTNSSLPTQEEGILYIEHNETAESAYRRLDNEGVCYDIELQYSSEVPRGFIIDIIETYEDEYHKYLTIIESLGPAELVIPNVIKVEYTEAVQRLHICGVLSVCALEMSTGRKQVVIWQSVCGVWKGDSEETRVYLVVGTEGEAVRRTSEGVIILPNDERFVSEVTFLRWLRNRAAFHKTEEGFWEELVPEEGKTRESDRIPSEPDNIENQTDKPQTAKTATSIVEKNSVIFRS